MNPEKARKMHRWAKTKSDKKCFARLEIRNIFWQNKQHKPPLIQQNEDYNHKNIQTARNKLERKMFFHKQQMNSKVSSYVRKLLLWLSIIHSALLLTMTQAIYDHTSSWKDVVWNWPLNELQRPQIEAESQLNHLLCSTNVFCTQTDCNLIWFSEWIC